MIQQETRLKVADNTGAKELLCIRVMGGSTRRYMRTSAILSLLPLRYNTGGVVKEGRCYLKAVVVRFL